MSVPSMTYCFLPLPLKMQSNGVLELRRGRSSCCCFILFAVFLSHLPARFLSFVSFPQNVFFSYISTNATLALMLTILVDLLQSPLPYPCLSYLSPAVSPPSAIILIYLLTLFHFLTKECTVATYSEV